MSDPLFHRDWKVIVDGLDVTGLRIQFKASKSSTKEPNNLDLQITNLSATSRGKMKAKGMLVVLEAGYLNTRAVIFSGDSRICDHKHEGANWTTKLQCGDGERVYQFSRVNKSYAAGADVKQVVTDCARAMSVNLGNLTEALNNNTLPIQSFEYGYACHGNAQQNFDRLIRSLGLTWSIQQGALLVAKKNEQAIQEVVVLSAATGLLGSPEHSPPSKEKTQSMLKCRSLLNPKIRPGVILRLDANNVKGDFVPVKVDHEGDSHGARWETVIEAVESKTKTVNV